SSPAPLPEAAVPGGFRFSGVACGIKPSGKPDLSLLVSDHPVVAAGVYTQNQVVAAPVTLCRGRTPSNTIRAVVTNSGNANACTGDQGTSDAEEMSRLVAQRLGCQPSDVLVMSTGVIGQTLPMAEIRNGIELACRRLSNTSESFLDASDAILTTDRERKIAAQTVDCRSKQYRVAAMAKGAGMISPNMATMLGLICTDASVTLESAQQLLARAANKSFNRASVDGHTSTNDTLLLLASGQSTPLSGDCLEKLAQAIDEVSIRLAKELVLDGEGASHLMAIHVHGAKNDADALCIARTVAASPLVKTAITGGDPNWGRIVSAAGYAEATLVPEKTSLEICGTAIYQSGAPVPFDASLLSQMMKDQVEVEIRLCVGEGAGSANFWSSNLTVDYVQFNSEYTT
ncbi:MAG: bifunctional glutamate N-acetyltransferase/amino-acid acetyltransferase ArgJ, partial [Pirellulales bacterium]|nr:bifunctional glutamate N-acetyltransferase/amino-acid acetyltransferase ArgJ [Pirellulales bacterium]